MALFKFLGKEIPSEKRIEEEYKKAIEKVHSYDYRCTSLRRDIKRYAEKTCQPEKGEDILGKKAEFFRIYSHRAFQWRCFHSLKYKEGRLKMVPSWTQKWHDYEQKDRLKAHRKWCDMIQKTR